MRRTGRRDRSDRIAKLLVIPVVIVGGLIGYVASEPQMVSSLINSIKGQRPTCDIKANINDRGEKIYHLPGDEYYQATNIDESRGERWFCSSWDAWWAGWRRSRV